MHRYIYFVVLIACAPHACGWSEPSDPVRDPAPPASPLPASSGSPDDVIVTVGHGEFFGRDGASLAPSRALFHQTQRAYLDQLLRSPEIAALGDEVSAMRAKIAGATDDELFANALLIEWLVDQARPPERATIKVVTGAMRNRYIEALWASPSERAQRMQSKGLDRDAARRLDDTGVIARVTFNSGQKYIDECAAAGVPIPPPMYQRPAWSPLNMDGDEIENELIEDWKKAELWAHRSTAPAGVCLALPRYESAAPDMATVLGIICLGFDSGRACFWDSPSALDFERDVVVGLDQFVGGFDLEANAQGVCTDCHAGENPFVVHSNKAVFSSVLGSFAGRWHDPIIHPNFPQNPGPTPLLDAVSSPRRCDDCHQAGRSGGRFPALSTELPGYCGSVLTRAALNPGPKRFMPPDGRPDQYTNHIEALRTACGMPPATGKVVSFFPPNGQGILSPPVVIDPLYGCAEQIAVRGAIVGAKVTLTVAGRIYQQIASNPDNVTFAVSPPLLVGDVAVARQEIDTMTSPLSAPVAVRDWRGDYPTGLPAPRVDLGLIYQCSSIIAVAHVPGAKVTVWVNGGSPVTTPTATGWSGIWPGKRPFDIGDEFTAQIQMCPAEPPSPISASGVRAVAAPTAMPAPVFEPARTFDGQRLVTVGGLTNGAWTDLKVSGTPAGRFATPVSWFPNYHIAEAFGRALTEIDTVSAQQTLCTSGPITVLPRTSKCAELPAPRIATPIPGTRFVVILSAIPGARIHVYDAAGTEIGDGAGSVVVLSRALVVGDLLSVTQQVGTCTSRMAHQISVVQRGQ